MKFAAKTLSLVGLKKSVSESKTDLLIERLADSKEFWDLIAKYSECVVTRGDFLADLTTEIEYQNETLDSDIEESNRVERSGGK